MDQQPQAIYLKDYAKPNFTIDALELVFDIQEEFVLVQSLLKMRKNSPDLSAEALNLDGDDLELISVKLDQRELTAEEYQATPKKLTIYHLPEQFELNIQTKIYPEKNTKLQGLYKSGQIYCTQCEAEGFRAITYFLDRPDVMTFYKTKIIADKKAFPVILSNGNLIAKGEAENGRHFAVWQDPFKKPSYLFALVAGNFDYLEDVFPTKSGRDVSLKIYVEPGNTSKATHAMLALKKAMRWDEETYQREYDLNLYMIVATRDFNMGAMENKGLNIFNDQYILAEPGMATDEDYLAIESVIGHEYFHNWTGNRITCRDWFQLSLKEGLTIFREQSFVEDTFSPAIARIRSVTNLRSRQFPEDASPIAHSVQPQFYIEINNFYSTTIYQKGSEIIRMLRTLLGNELFSVGMQEYFKLYDGQAVTIEDFIHAFERVSYQDLSQFKLWYREIGTPKVNVSDDYDESKETYTLHFSQEKGLKVDSPLVIPIAMALFDPQGKEIPVCTEDKDSKKTKVLILSEYEQSFRFPAIKTRPCPSLLRNFSAPIKLNYPYTEAQLNLLAAHDNDDFNRWEAGQIQAHKHLQEMITKVQNKEPLTAAPSFIANFENILSRATKAQGKDKFFIAELLTLPSEKLVAEKMVLIDYTAIHEAREYFIRAMAKALEAPLLELYHLNHRSSYTQTLDLSLEAMANRRLKNLCLGYLLKLAKEEHVNLAWNQFQTSLGQNMSDTLGALRGLTDINTEIQQQALNLFYQRWHTNPQGLYKWFSQQALSLLPDTLERIKALVQSSVFDSKNPNQVYALIGTFTQQNPSSFHNKEGKAYQFLSELVLSLDKQNPILASAMVKPLLDWRRYVKENQDLMRQEVEHILSQPKLSKGLYELVKASA